MAFNYKDGEDYVCVLCGGNKHAHEPRPDNLCDRCWELKMRIELSPALARKVLSNLEAHK